MHDAVTEENTSEVCRVLDDLVHILCKYTVAI